MFFHQVELNTEKSRLVENLEASDAKKKALEQLRHCHDYQHDALQRQVLELTASSEDKVTIGIESSQILSIINHILICHFKVGCYVNFYFMNITRA